MAIFGVMHGVCNAFSILCTKSMPTIPLRIRTAICFPKVVSEDEWEKNVCLSWRRGHLFRTIAYRNIAGEEGQKSRDYEFQKCLVKDFPNSH